MIHTLNMISSVYLVDLLLSYTGSFNRQQLMDLTGMSIATATRTIKKYKENNDENLKYVVENKRYEITDVFKSNFNIAAENALILLAYGQQITQTGYLNTIGPASTSNGSSKLSSDIIPAVTRAIYRKTPIDIEYYGTQSSQEKRTILPLAIFESRGNWYVRVFDLKDSRYKTFKFIRINHVIGFSNKKLTEVINDTDWFETVTLTLGAHPKHHNPKGLNKDLGLLDKPVFNLTVPKALVGFKLAELAVDASLEGTLNPEYFQYRLLNLHELMTVSSMRIAPGFKVKR
ncbi:MAG: hypothetical protein ACJAS9_002842 [Polaribacter sp.]|jgi:hypothetical protein